MVKRMVVLGLVLLLLPMPLIAQTGPKISFQSMEHDFGDVKYGDSPSVELTFTNIGDEELILGGIDSSCGCARAIRGSDKIAPGRAGKIHAQIETSGMRPGRHFKTIWVDSNDPEHPRTTLKLLFKIVRHVSIEPETVGLNLPGDDKDAVFRLTATNHWTEPVTLKPPKLGDAKEVLLIPQEVVVPPGGKMDFQIKVGVKREPGQFYVKGTALIETDDPLEKTLTVRYLIRLQPTGVRDAEKPS